MAGPYDHLVGELQPGQTGWLPLDESGIPSGPATLEPPRDLDARAASVLHNPSNPLPEDAHALTSVSGAPLVPPLNSNVDRRVTPGAPVLSHLDPVQAQIGTPDVTMVVHGEGFDENSVIIFNGGEEPTTFLSDTQVSTIVKPSLASAEISVPVEVRSLSGVSNSLQFAFVQGKGPKEERSRR